MEGLHQHPQNYPQWNVQETKDLLTIRAELDQIFMETKRNKLLWDIISSKMKEKGHTRSPEQCKFKWKNLIARYKGFETMEVEAMKQQFPFYEELEAIFASRMQRMIWSESETAAAAAAAASGSISKRKEVFSHGDDDEEDSQDNKGANNIKKAKKAKKVSGINASSNNLRMILERFMKQQVKIEAKWREALEAREEERKKEEFEWRERMKTLENERIRRERVWREREEQRRMREEGRAEKMDILITALLNKN